MSSMSSWYFFDARQLIMFKHVSAPIIFQSCIGFVSTCIVQVGNAGRQIPVF